MAVGAGRVERDLAVRRVQRRLVAPVDHRADRIGQRGVGRVWSELAHLLDRHAGDLILAKREVCLRQAQMPTGVLRRDLRDARELRSRLGDALIFSSSLPRSISARTSVCCSMIQPLSSHPDGCCSHLVIVNGLIAIESRMAHTATRKAVGISNSTTSGR